MLGSVQVRDGYVLVRLYVETQGRIERIALSAGPLRFVRSVLDLLATTPEGFIDVEPD